MQVDVIIIGAGISGLYFVHKYLKNTNIKYIILEKNDYIGGRIKYDTFYDTTIQLGAGVILPYHTNLLNLVKELNLELIEIKSKPNKIDNTIIPQIKKIYYDNLNELNNLNLSFIQFINLYFEPTVIHKIIEYSDYNDYFDENLHKVVNNYPLDDILIKEKQMYVLKNGWKDLIDKLNNKYIQLNESVIEINKSKSFNVITNKNKYICKKIVVAGDLSCANIKWNISIDINNLYKNIGSVPFYRIYTYHKEPIDVKTLIKTNNLIDKVIPINKHILMAVYTDNYKAIKLKELLDNNKNNKINILNKLLKQVIPNISPINDIYEQFWNIGIHYYKTNNHTETNYWLNHDIVFCGEIFSNTQGWVEGAIQSINNLN